MSDDPRHFHHHAGNTRKTICPHCWHRFGVEELLAIAQHQSLMGDPVLGDDAFQRFLPSRFTPEGHAIDAHGLVCPDLACPHCHLPIPSSLMEKSPFFLSIIGAPASGKSYWLATMIWELRSLMPGQFAFSFGDADSMCNRIVNEYERTLFLCEDDEKLVTLPKTDMQGELYNQVTIDNMRVNLPRPFLFSLLPESHHPAYEKRKTSLEHTIVLYDNAGEHFEPGMDSVTNPGTQHLAKSQGIFFIFDPTKDTRFRRRCHSDDPQIQPGAHTERQEILLAEAISRIRRIVPAWRRTKYDRPLFIVVTKFDIWRSMLKFRLPKAWIRKADAATASIDSDAVLVTSFALRHLLKGIAPELVSTAEAFASRVIYVPVSALGHSPAYDPASPESGLHVKPKYIRPEWTTTPLLYMFALLGLVRMVRRRSAGKLPLPKTIRVSGKRLLVTLPNAEREIEVPMTYLGRPLQCPETGAWFRVPSRNELDALVNRT